MALNYQIQFVFVLFKGPVAWTAHFGTHLYDATSIRLTFFHRCPEWFPDFFFPYYVCNLSVSYNTILTLLDIRKCNSVRFQFPLLCPYFLLITLLIRHAEDCFGGQNHLILVRNRRSSLNEASIAFCHFSSRAFLHFL